MTDIGDRKVVWEGRYIRAVVRGRWEFVERKNITGIVGMIPVTDDGRLVLIEQFRPAVDSRVVELPAGLVGDVPDQADEPLVAAANRELIEETGYRAGTMTRVFHGSASAGISAEQITFFLATDLEKVGPGGGDSSEQITVYEVPLGNVVDWLDAQASQGAVIDVKIYSALHFCAPLIQGADNP